MNTNAYDGLATSLVWTQSPWTGGTVAMAPGPVLLSDDNTCYAAGYWTGHQIYGLLPDQRWITLRDPERWVLVASLAAVVQERVVSDLRGGWVLERDLVSAL